MKYNCIDSLLKAGISYEDATALRRISMTLQRWHELECGDGNDYGSWCIARGNKTKEGFNHDDDGKPYLERHHYLHGRGKDYVSYSPMPDRERGALKRLAAIMARYPGFVSYVQGDPRGAALYILRPDDLPADFDANLTRGEWLSSHYYRGGAVYK